MHDDDNDWMFYAALGAAVLYFLYKQGFFSSVPPAGAAVPALPAPASTAVTFTGSTNPASIPVNLPATSANVEVGGGQDFGITDPTANW